MENNKNTKIALSIVIMLIITITSVIATATMYILLMESKNDEQENININNSSLNNNIGGEKTDNAKKLVYDAEYTYGDLEGKSYTSATMQQTYSLKNIVVPYIDIDSTDAIKANDEIKKLFEQLAEIFKEELEDSQTWYNISSYKTFMNDDILSIIITIERGGTDVPIYEYYTYNFDLKTQKLLSYNELYESIGISSDDIDSIVKNSIKNCNRLSELTEDVCLEGTTVNTYVNNSIQNYEESVTDNSIQYFLDNNKQLNVIVTIEIPDGNGAFDTIITVE